MKMSFSFKDLNLCKMFLTDIPSQELHSAPAPSTPKTGAEDPGQFETLSLMF